MVRQRHLIYVGLLALIVVFIMAINSHTFTLNTFLRPVPRSPQIGKVNSDDFNNGVYKADDAIVIQSLKDQYLYGPSKLPYNLSDPDGNPSMGQAQRIDFILQAKRNGFYVECGALDGEARSNTLFFERERGWSGLLIEADPKNFKKLIGKHRKAYMSPTCLAPSSHPTLVFFQQHENLGHIVGKQQSFPSNDDGNSVLEVQCFPLLSYITALGVKTVDYFSLDIEGAEFSVLKTIPWDKVDIRTLSVEFIHDPEGKEAIQKFMASKGYYVHSEVTHPNWLANDFIFVKNTVL